MVDVYMRWRTRFLIFILCSGICPALTQGRRIENTCSGSNTIVLGERGRWGLLTSPGFPEYLPTPLKCSWIIDNSKYADDPHLSLYLYLTQVYIEHSMISIEECQDTPFDCTPLPTLSRNATYRRFQSRFIKISLNVPSGPDIHIRVMEVSDVFGFNMTYEVARNQDRGISFFKCSLSECHLNGECIVQSSLDGREVGSMECRCNSPLDDSAVSEPKFYGPRCQYHNKHGHCTGPGDGHDDAKQRCRGEPCYYFTSRFVKCNCSQGIGGKSCEIYESDQLSGEPSSCSSEHNIRIRIQLDARSSAQIETHITDVWSELCRCRILSIHKSEGWFELEMVGDPDILVDLVRKIRKRGVISSSLPIRDIQISSSNPQVCIEKLSLNQENPIRNSHEFILSCLAIGGKNMAFSWSKDDYKVNVSLTERYIIQDIVKQDQVWNGTLRWRNLGILHVTNAKKYDSGTFRCTVSDEGATVSMSMDIPVLVSEKPRVEVYPQALVLTQEKNEVTTSIKDSTIFCFAQDNVFSEVYNFKWLKRRIGEDRSKNRDIDFYLEPERFELLSLPVGVLLRLKNIKDSAIYTCQVELGNMITELEVPVHVVPNHLFVGNTCPMEKMRVVWPTTKIKTEIRRPCSGDDEGFVKRKCEQRSHGDPGKWGNIDESECVKKNVLLVQDHLQTIISGYTRDGDTDTLGKDIVMNLEDLCSGSLRIEEWKIVLKVVEDTMAYLQKSDHALHGYRYPWTNQIQSFKTEFFKLIKCLLSEAKRFILKDRIGDILELLRRSSLIMGRELDISNSSNFSFHPYGETQISKINLKQVKNDTTLLGANTSSNWEINDSFKSGIQVYLSPNLTRNSNIKDEVFIVSVIFMEQLHQTVQEYLNSGHRISTYEINSHLITIALESENMIRKSEFTYNPVDTISIEENFIISIQFTYLNSSFNETLRNVKCGEVSGDSHRTSLNLKPTENCKLKYTNRTGLMIPTCECSRTGTFGLLVSRPARERDGIRVNGVSKPVVYGCLTSFILSVLTWGLLIKSYLENSNKLITILKVVTTCGVIMSDMIFMITLNRFIPTEWNHYTSAGLQISTLTSLSSQLGISTLILLQHTRIQHSRLSYILVFLVSACSPSIIIGILSIGCGFNDSKYGGWWLNIGGFHFIRFIAIMSVFLAFLLLVLGVTWITLSRELNTSSLESKMSITVNRSLGTLKRVFLITLLLILNTILSIFYCNSAGADSIADYTFGVSSASVGCFLLFCYILRSESYIMVWCGDKDAWTEMKHVVQDKSRNTGSFSDSGESRITSSSAPPSRINSSTAQPSRLISSSAQPSRQISSSVKSTNKESFRASVTFPGIREPNKEENNQICSKLYPLTPIEPTPGLRDTNRSETKHPPRARCYIRDDNISRSLSNPPEPLSQLLGRVSKQPRSFLPDEGRKLGQYGSRRSTISSNMTLTNSTDVSEYVQQESNPVKPEFFQHNLNQTSELGSDYSRIRFSPDTYATMSPSSPIPEGFEEGIWKDEDDLNLEIFSNYINTEGYNEHRRRSALLESRFNSSKDQNPGLVTPTRLKHRGNCLLDKPELINDGFNESQNQVSSQSKPSPVTYIFAELGSISPMKKFDEDFVKRSFTPNATLSHQDASLHSKLKSEWRSLGEIRYMAGFSGTEMCNGGESLNSVFSDDITKG